MYADIIFLFSRFIRDFNARSYKADKRTHIFCFAQVTVNTERNEIKRKVNRWRARARRKEKEREVERNLQPGTSRPISLVGRSFVTRRAFPMHHGENTVTAKSRASTRKAYIGARFITRLTHVSSSGLARQEIRPLSTESEPVLLTNTCQHASEAIANNLHALETHICGWYIFYVRRPDNTHTHVAIVARRYMPIQTMLWVNSDIIYLSTYIHVYGIFDIFFQRIEIMFHRRNTSNFQRNEISLHSRLHSFTFEISFFLFSFFPHVLPQYSFTTRKTAYIMILNIINIYCT